MYIDVKVTTNALLRIMHFKWHQTASNKNKTVKLNSNKTYYNDKGNYKGKNIDPNYKCMVGHWCHKSLFQA